MTPQVLARDILNRIINENTPFSLALKQAFKKNEVSKEDKANISAMVGCVLRHYLVLSNVINKQYLDLDSVGAIALMIAFSNALLIGFYKRYTVALIGGLWIIIDTCLTLFCKRYTDNKRAFHLCVIGLFIYLGLFLLLLFLLIYFDS